MSQVLTVPTHFNDLGELSEGFLDRVEQDTLILYGPVAYEDGSEIEFVVLLADGSPALEGVGRVRAAVDGGADRVPETRYDVVVEALQLDGRSEVVFERLVLARQAVSDHPPAHDAEPPTGDIDVAPSDDELSSEPDTVPPDEEEPDTVPPTASDAPDTVPPAASDEDDDEEYEYDDEPATVIAAVDAEAMMVEAEAVSEAESVPASESVAATVAESAAESVPAAESVSEPAPELEFGEEDDVEVEATMSDASDWDEEAVASDELASDEEAAASGELAPDEEAAASEEGEFDSEYAFEHGIAAEPQVGMPVPIPSMAAPPEAPPAPPTLRLAEPPDGLTRPSWAQAEESAFTADGEVSDVHTTGLFVYENGLPIPSRPPLPDLNRPRSAAPVEAADGYDVEESEPPESNDDEYEEVRLSDFAEAAEEG
ncbi:MAG: hypothetical protein JRJ24_11340 [Deltaproteobacteria bacterium]|nr:hypothetical protein [Deltaproteobacteria bacterium]